MPLITTPRCIECGKTSTIDITDEEFKLLYAPERPPLATVFPTRSLEFRELFITGTHPDCWDRIFAGVEDDE